MMPMDQHGVLSEITRVLIADLPVGWRRLTVDYTVQGQKAAVGSRLRMTDGSTGSLVVPRTLAPLFSRLRDGMHIAGIGTWTSLVLTVDAPDTFTARYR
jgi:hypothetical protein